MNKSPIFTIGYGNRSIEEFLQLLSTYRIQYLIDVRTNPRNSYNGDFVKNVLKEHVAKVGTRYVFMGDTLGGKPVEEECYTSGRVDYKKVSQQSFYKKGISRLKIAYQKNLLVAVMCSELRPESCHRSKLIGQSLLEAGINVVHIDEKGLIVSQQSIINRITGGQLSLFEEGFTSRKKYKEE
ncbi:DUF488 domain-containing protein [Bacillus cereus group sp. MYBK120-1]|uniref:DUF488 domain-containing protein n=1 Tax=Bacillus cereus group TaxID=86661 RepID=UPI00234CD6C0|nr:DUF488 domain-containing protein [Bacillus cereus]MDC7729666.1 DUF488 domain-containing protein [Bacillus cereus]